MQEKVVIELYKSIVKSMTPIELKFLEKKVINVDSITNISTLDVFLENLIRNMIEYHLYNIVSENCMALSYWEKILAIFLYRSRYVYIWKA